MDPTDTGTSTPIQYDAEAIDAIDVDAVAVPSRGTRRDPSALPPPFPPPPFPSLPQHVLVVYNVSKASNVGPLLRTAVAFSASAVAVVGARRLSTFGHQRTARFLPVAHYGDVRSAAQHIRAQGFELVGIEIGEEATELSAFAFSERTAFVPGNEGGGLNAAVRPYIDRLVYIRQSGAGTASLNVATAVGIVLYAFQQWAAFPEQRSAQGKFLVDEHKAVTDARESHRTAAGDRQQLQAEGNAVLSTTQDGSEGGGSSGADDVP